jgi:hypothetical protein
MRARMFFDDQPVRGSIDQRAHGASFTGSNDSDSSRVRR